MERKILSVDSIHKTGVNVFVFGEVKVGMIRDVNVRFGDSLSSFSVIELR